MMEKIVVVVEEVEVSKTALLWALHNIIRHGDVLTLLHVYSSRNKNKNKKKKKVCRNLRLKGYQLALSFRDICSNASFPNVKTEIIVTEGEDQEEEEEGGGIAARIASFVTEIGASTLVLGLHQRSFLYRLVMPNNNITRNLKCKVLAIKEPTTLTPRTISLQDCSTNMDFSQIEIATLSVPEVPPQRISYQICPDPNAIIWRSRPSKARISS